jgi:hypothetical protein
MEHGLGDQKYAAGRAFSAMGFFLARAKSQLEKRGRWFKSKLFYAPLNAPSPKSSHNN